MKLPHSDQRKYAFLVKRNEKSKSQKKIPINKVSLEILQQRLGHRPARTILAGNTANIWQYFDIRVDPDPLFTSCHISTINKLSLNQVHLLI